MARKKPKKRVNKPAAVSKKPASRWRRRLPSAIVLIVLLAGTAFGVSAYKKNYAETHDLSVIGNGVPTLVQVHDPKCPKCRKLMSNTKVALGRIDTPLQYRIADIKTPAGRNFQNTHGVQHVTLLLFDGKGKRKATLSGVKEADVLEKELDRFIRRLR